MDIIVVTTHKDMEKIGLDMRIGIDIDGVLTNIEQFLLDYGSKFCVENNLPLNIKKSNYDEKITRQWLKE